MTPQSMWPCEQSVEDNEEQESGDEAACIIDVPMEAAAARQRLR